MKTKYEVLALQNNSTSAVSKCFWLITRYKYKPSLPVKADSVVTEAAGSATESSDLPALHQTTDDTLDLLYQAEHISSHNTATFLLQRWCQTDGKQSEKDTM